MEYFLRELALNEIECVNGAGDSPGRIDGKEAFFIGLAAVALVASGAGLVLAAGAVTATAASAAGLAIAGAGTGLSAAGTAIAVVDAVQN